MPEGLPAAFELRIPTDLAFVRPVRKMIEGLLTSHGWDEDHCDDAALLVTEVVQNAIEHGSACDGNEVVRLVTTLAADGVTFLVSDPGTGRDPRIALERDPAAPVPLDAARGRGLFLINRLAQAFERDLNDAGGLRILVRKEFTTS